MKIRPWVAASVFVWTVAGAVALAAYSGHPEPTGLEKVGAPSAKTNLKTNALPAAPKRTAVAWEPSFEQAMQRARTENKPILIDFYTDWCQPCKMMEAEVYPDSRVIAQSEKWVTVKVNGDKRPDVMEAYGVNAFPTVLFAASNGKPFASAPGFIPAPDFAGYLEQAHQKWQKSVAPAA